VTGVFADTYLVVCREDPWDSDDDESEDTTGGDHLVMKASGVGSASRIMYTTEYGWQIFAFTVDSRGCVLLFEMDDDTARLRVVNTTSSKTRDLGYIDPEFPVCVQTTEF